MRCPHCNGKVDRIDKFCRNCGRSVVGVLEDTETPAESAAAPLTRAFASSRDDSQTWGARLNAYGSTYGSAWAHPANATALVQETRDGTTVLFGPRSALPGAAFALRGVPAIQLPLGFQRPFKIASDSTNRAPNAPSLR